MCHIPSQYRKGIRSFFNFDCCEVDVKLVEATWCTYVLVKNTTVVRIKASFLLGAKAFLNQCWRVLASSIRVCHNGDIVSAASVLVPDTIMLKPAAYISRANLVFVYADCWLYRSGFDNDKCRFSGSTCPSALLALYDLLDGMCKSAIPAAKERCVTSWYRCRSRRFVKNW